MIKKRTFSFLILGAIFALIHQFAVLASLYWYYWWFDIMMHIWGGVLIALGVHTFSTFKYFPYKPTLFVLLVVLFLMTGLWEVFEYFAGLWQPAAYYIDTIQDIVLGFSGGLLAHFVLSKYTIEG